MRDTARGQHGHRLAPVVKWVRLRSGRPYGDSILSRWEVAVNQGRQSGEPTRACSCPPYTSPSTTACHYISTVVPISNTRAGGSEKKSAALAALRRIKV